MKMNGSHNYGTRLANERFHCSLSSFDCTSFDCVIQPRPTTRKMAEPAPWPRCLEDMKGDSQARCLDFFEGFALDLPAPLDAELKAIAAELFTTFKRARLGGLFKVSPGDAEEAMARATSDPSGWRLAIEEQAGFTFGGVGGTNVPASAALAKIVAPSVQQRETKMEKRIRLGTSTVSDDLLALGSIPENPLEEECFSVFTTDVLNTEAIEGEVQTFITKVLSKYASSHWKTNLGAPLLRNIAMQAHKRIKRLPRKGKVDGAARSFQTMIYHASVNRAHVCAPPLSSLVGLCPHLLTTRVAASFAEVVCRATHASPRGHVRRGQGAQLFWYAQTEWLRLRHGE